jgi:hypothetical protein
MPTNRLQCQHGLADVDHGVKCSDTAAWCRAGGSWSEPGDLVRGTGIEPVRLAAAGFKPATSTYSVTRARPWTIIVAGPRAAAMRKLMRSLGTHRPTSRLASAQRNTT